MNIAISKRDFELAGKFDLQINELEQRLEAESKKVTESDTPDNSRTVSTSYGGMKTFESRADLENEIAVVSSAIEESVQSKEFKKANAMQTDLDKLVNAREALPSIEELTAKLGSRQAQMKAAVSEKRFGEADSLNEEIEMLTTRLEVEKKLCPVVAPNTEQTKEPVKATMKTVNVPTTVPSISSSSLKSTATPAQPSVRSSSASVAPTVRSTSASVVSRQPIPSASVASTTKLSKNVRLVAKLKPKQPIVSTMADSVRAVSKLLTTHRANATVIIDDSGALAGIITDTDITRRVVAKLVDPDATLASEVMTASPTCVKSSDLAMDALSIMVENHFRHLPVTDESGSVVGLLDIAKCLDEAIGKLEKKIKNGNGKIDGGSIDLASLSGGQQNGSQVAMMEQLLRSLLEQTMGTQTIPTLRSLLEGKPTTFVSPESTILEAALLMAERRKAALVVDEGELVGIFSFKDMMTRVVAKDVDVAETTVQSVMTPSPDAVAPDISVLEALQIMHDNRFLTLPVCESDGTVVGIVDVLDVVYGCGGADGWRSVINSAFDVQDDSSDASSVISSPLVSSRSMVASTNRGGQTLLPVEEFQGSDVRPVSMLRPSKPVITESSQSILSVAKTLTQNRSAATLVTAPDQARLVGIMTATDITRRAVAKRIDVGSVPLAEVMTKNPTCVGVSDPAVDALTKMIENRFRHLPVVDDDGSIVGVIDIAKCLNAAISKLQRAEKKNTANSDSKVSQTMNTNGDAQAQAIQLLLGTLMERSFGSVSSPSLRSLLAGNPLTVVNPETSVYDASQLMTEHRKAALVIDENERLVGIFGFKDMMKRVVAQELLPESTPIEAVMTRNPRTVSPNLTVVEALQIMHESKILSLPVCEEDGSVVGLVDVLDVMYGCGGSQGWRSVFSSAMDIADDTTVASRRSEFSSSRVRSFKPRDEKTVAKLRPSRPNIAESEQSILSVTLMLKRKRASACIVTNTRGALAGIITDTDITRRGKLRVT